MAVPLSYPPAPRTDLVEILHGVKVADPFRDLEHASAPATRAWVDAENALTRQQLDGRLRNEIVDRLRVLHRHSRFSIPSVRGKRVFFTLNDGTRNQAVLGVYEEPGGSRREAGPTEHFRVLVDPNLLDPDGTSAITEFEPDEHGDRVVYALSVHGSDRQELRVVDVATGAVLDDRICWVKFASIVWFGDAFFYTRFPEPGSVPPEHQQYFCQVWLHVIGQPQSSDRLIYHRPDKPEAIFDLNITSDQGFLAITGREGSSDKAEVLVCVLTDDCAVGEPQCVIGGFRDNWTVIDGRGRTLWLRTNASAPFGRIVAIDLDNPSYHPRTIVEETTETIAEAHMASGRLLVHVLRDASSRLFTVNLEGRDRREIAPPHIGTILGIGAEWGNQLAIVAFASFVAPPHLRRVDVDRRSLDAPLLAANLPIDPEQYVTEQVWYPSKDGVKVSMFLVRRSAPLAATDAVGAVYLTGYGGFNISLTPGFDPSDFVWLDRGGTMAVAHLRGGGEYGEAWHEGGMRERKQTVFDDFVAAAKWLYQTGRAKPGRLAIEGGSNGGLLVGAAIVQQPDLFGAAICRVPVADMLRYHLFTVGRFWIPEYGSADDPEQFKYLFAYSPYHNVRDGVAYPPTLVMTADTDDRVDPGMAKKFAARLQEAVRNTAGGPILLRVETRAGHGLGKPIAKLVDEQADIYAFVLSALAPA